MRKIQLILLEICLLFFSIFSESIVHAETLGEKTGAFNVFNFSLSANNVTAVASGSDKIKITIQLVVTDNSYGTYGSQESPKPICINNSPNASEISITVGGSSNTLVGAQGQTFDSQADTSGPWTESHNVPGVLYNVGNAYNCSSGNIELYLSSTKAEVKYLKVALANQDNLRLPDLFLGDKVDRLASVEFSVAKSTAVQTPATTSTTTPSTAATPVAPTKPTLALSTTSRIGTNDISSTLDTTQPISIIPAQKLAFSGTTSANAKVTLTIKSDPITREVTADANGAWAYTLDPIELALETGNHTVTAMAMDTAGIASDSIELAKFELKEAPTPSPTQEPYKFKARDLLTPINYVLGGILLLLIGGLIFVIMKRRKRVKLNINNQMN